jgi:hypothetical protein
LAADGRVVVEEGDVGVRFGGSDGGGDTGGAGTDD